jgi:hypothetical protein
MARRNRNRNGRLQYPALGGQSRPIISQAHLERLVREVEAAAKSLERSVPPAVSVHQFTNNHQGEAIADTINFIEQAAHDCLQTDEQTPQDIVKAKIVSHLIKVASETFVYPQPDVISLHFVDAPFTIAGEMACRPDVAMFLARYGERDTLQTFVAAAQQYILGMPSGSRRELLNKYGIAATALPEDAGLRTGSIQPVLRSEFTDLLIEQFFPLPKNTPWKDKLVEQIQELWRNNPRYRLEGSVLHGAILATRVGRDPELSKEAFREKILADTKWRFGFPSAEGGPFSVEQLRDNVRHLLMSVVAGGKQRANIALSAANAYDETLDNILMQAARDFVIEALIGLENACAIDPDSIPTAENMFEKKVRHAFSRFDRDNFAVLENEIYSSMRNKPSADSVTRSINRAFIRHIVAELFLDGKETTFLPAEVSLPIANR